MENYISSVVGKKANIAFCGLDYAIVGVIVSEIMLDIHAIKLLVVVNDCNVYVVLKIQLG